MTEILLYNYFRSTASYRVRIALNLKSLPYDEEFINLRRSKQKTSRFRSINPQQLLPALVVDSDVLTQSLAICEFLEESYPDPPLLPSSAVERAKVRAFAQVITCDTHPIQNLRVLEKLRSYGLTDVEVTDWAASFIADGLEACDRLVSSTAGPFAFGGAPTLADVCLVPQLVNARRFGVDLRWERLLQIEAACLGLEAFARAAPDRQADAQ